jgi:pimeloyl-ACP methyl ester carboxylesterase
VIDNASHAAIEEQPEAISRALIDFAKGLWP